MDTETKIEGALSVELHRLVLYLRAIWRSRIAYDSDMGGFREALDWEMGNVDGWLGLTCRKPEFDGPYEHGYYCGKRERLLLENAQTLATRGSEPALHNLNQTNKNEI